MKRIAALSDIHGNILALEKVAKDLGQRDVDLVVNLGDHLSGPLWPKETSIFLKQQKWLQIRGNHDRQLINQDPNEHGLSDQHAYQALNDDDLGWLGTLPACAEIGDNISVCHGSPADDLAYLLETIENGRTRLATHDEILKRLTGNKSYIVLCGHSHIPRVMETKAGQLIVNPGSVGLPAYDDIRPEPHVVETGSPHARYAVLEQIGERWAVELIAIPYDHSRAAARALENNRKDWAIGLQTGYMR